MCGRFSRARRDLDYVVPLLADVTYPEASIFRPSYNIAPGTMQPVIYPTGPRLEHWGYRPTWAIARKVPMMINSRLDKSGTSTWKAMWKTSRVVVPADGWYEWVVEEGKKQPYFITPIDGKPLFFAGLTSVKPGAEHRDGDGFVIVTGAADAGLLDVHDRRPLVLGADDAREWLHPETTFEKASHLANNVVTPAEAFRWFRVSTGVNRVGNDEPAFNEPI
jgi:putative SOS response-associated peptidase YedK